MTKRVDKEGKEGERGWGLSTVLRHLSGTRNLSSSGPTLSVEIVKDRHTRTRSVKWGDLESKG